MTKELFCSTIEKMQKQAKKDIDFECVLNVYLGGREDDDIKLRIINSNCCYNALFDVLVEDICEYGEYNTEDVYEILSEIVFNPDENDAPDFYDEAFGLKDTNRFCLKNIS